MNSEHPSQLYSIICYFVGAISWWAPHWHIKGSCIHLKIKKRGDTNSCCKTAQDTWQRIGRIQVTDYWTLVTDLLCWRLAVAVIKGNIFWNMMMKLLNQYCIWEIQRNELLGRQQKILPWIFPKWIKSKISKHMQGGRPNSWWEKGFHFPKLLILSFFKTRNLHKALASSFQLNSLQFTMSW